MTRLGRYQRKLETGAQKGRSLKTGPLFLALCFQGVLLLGTAFVVVIAPLYRNEPEFSSHKTIYLPQRELEHREAVAELQQVASPPVMMERLTTTSLLPDRLPQLPSFPKVEYSLSDKSLPVNRSHSLLGEAGLVSALQGLGQGASAASLFGIEDQAERFLIMFDDGGSVLNKARASGAPIEIIKEEAIRMVEQLNANTLFGIVNFVRQVGSFRDFLLPATVTGKASARDWINRNFGNRRKQTGLTVTGSGIEAAFEVAFQLQPDVIYVMSDADFQRNKVGPGGSRGEQVPWGDLRSSLRELRHRYDRDLHIHFIGFQVEQAHRTEIKRLVRIYHGKYRDIGSGE